jgi:hypothetical protein
MRSTDVCQLLRSSLFSAFNRSVTSFDAPSAFRYPGVAAPVPPPPEFVLTVNPTLITVQQGLSETYCDYNGDSGDAASTSNSVTVTVTQRISSKSVDRVLNHILDRKDETRRCDSGFNAPNLRASFSICSIRVKARNHRISLLSLNGAPAAFLV